MGWISYSRLSQKKKNTRLDRASDASRAARAPRARKQSYLITFSFTVKRRLTNNYHRPRRRASLCSLLLGWSTRSPRAAASFPLIRERRARATRVGARALSSRRSLRSPTRGRLLFASAVFPFTEGPRPDYAPTTPD